MHWTEQQLAEYQFKHSTVKSTTDRLREVIEKVQKAAPLEDQEQAALIQWLKMKGIKHHHSPNGGHRHKAVAAKLKSQGVAAGFPDLMIFPAAGGQLPILYIEMKRLKGSTTSEEQKGWLGYLNELSGTHNVQATVCKGCLEAIKFITSWGY